MWGTCAAEWGPPGGQDGPVLAVRGDGPPQPGTGDLGPPSSGTGPLPASAAAGRDAHMLGTYGGQMFVDGGQRSL